MFRLGSKPGLEYFQRFGIKHGIYREPNYGVSWWQWLFVHTASEVVSGSHSWSYVRVKAASQVPWSTIIFILMLVVVVCFCCCWWWWWWRRRHDDDDDVGSGGGDDRVGGSSGISSKKVKQSHHRPDRPVGFQEVEAPIFQDNRHAEVVGLSALRTSRLYPALQEIFLVLISVRGWVNPRAIVRPEGLRQWKISLTPSAGSAVPQPTAPPRALGNSSTSSNLFLLFNLSDLRKIKTRFTPTDYNSGCFMVPLSHGIWKANPGICRLELQIV